MRLEPVSDRVMVKRDTAESTTKSGLVIPENSKEKPTIGTVIAVGEGSVLGNNTFLPVGVDVGEVVMFGEYSGTEVEVLDEKFVIMKESDIIGIVKGDKLIPLHDRVLVEQDPADSMTKSSILHIPETAKKKQLRGTVLATGKGRVLSDGKLRELKLKEGNRVIFGKYSGSEISFLGKKYIIAREEDMLAVIHSEA